MKYKSCLPFLLLVLLFACKNLTEQEKVKADLAQLLTDLETEYAYQVQPLRG